MPVSHEQRLIFIHIPKNAGTSITESSGLAFVDQGHHSARYYRKRYPAAWGRYFSFAVVRNPWDRCVSNFEYARMERSYWHSPDGTTRYGTHPDFNCLSGMDFEECITLLMRRPSVLRHRGWVPQYSWITDWWGQIKVDRVFRYEQLSFDRQFTELFPNLPSMNCSTRCLGDYRAYYDGKTRDVVYKIYKKDINLFGFEF